MRSSVATKGFTLITKHRTFSIDLSSIKLRFPRSLEEIRNRLNAIFAGRLRSILDELRKILLSPLWTLRILQFSLKFQ